MAILTVIAQNYMIIVSRVIGHYIWNILGNRATPLSRAYVGLFAAKMAKPTAAAQTEKENIVATATHESMAKR